MAPKFKPKRVLKNDAWYWRLDLRSVGQGRKFFDTEDEAKDFASELRSELEQHGRQSLVLSIEDRLEFTANKERLRQVKATITQAVDFFLKFNRPPNPLRVPAAGESFDEIKRRLGCRERYLEKIRSVTASMERFRPGLMVHEWTQEDVRGWRDSKKALSSRKYALQDANSFFVFAMAQKMTQMNPCDGIEDVRLDEFEKGILSPEQMKIFFETVAKVEKRLLRFFADQAFGGLRASEAALVSPEDEKDSHLYLPPGKTRHHGYVEWNEKWMKVRGSKFRIEKNKVILLPGKSKMFYGRQIQRRTIRKIKAAATAALLKKGLVTADFVFPQNFLRHSFCSYGAVKFGATEAARLARHSEKTQRSHYRRPVSAEAAEAYWKV